MVFWSNPPTQPKIKFEIDTIKLVDSKHEFKIVDKESRDMEDKAIEDWILPYGFSGLAV